MRHLRKLLDSLGLFKRDPAKTIGLAYNRLKNGTHDDDDLTLLDNVIDAVCRIAGEKDEPAPGKGEQQPVTTTPLPTAPATPADLTTGAPPAQGMADPAAPQVTGFDPVKEQRAQLGLPAEQAPNTVEVWRGEAFVAVAPLDKDPTKIGRLKSSRVFLDDEAVARMHAVIEPLDGGQRHQIVSLVREGERVSLNGTPVADREPIKDGDRIQIGPFELRVALAPKAEG